jgi:hypothetical protein
MGGDVRDRAVRGQTDLIRLAESRKKLNYGEREAMAADCAGKYFEGLMIARDASCQRHSGQFSVDNF